MPANPSPTPLPDDEKAKPYSEEEIARIRELARSVPVTDGSIERWLATLSAARAASPVAWAVYGDGSSGIQPYRLERIEANARMYAKELREGRVVPLYAKEGA